MRRKWPGDLPHIPTPYAVARSNRVPASKKARYSLLTHRKPCSVHSITSSFNARASSIEPKALNWRNCAVKIPDWVPDAESPSRLVRDDATTDDRRRAVNAAAVGPTAHTDLPAISDPVHRPFELTRSSRTRSLQRSGTIVAELMTAAHIATGARTVTHLADHFGQLKRTALSMRDSFGATQRGYFTPSQDDEVAQLLLSYWQSRKALFELIEEFVEIDGPKTRQTEPFLIAYSAAIVLVDAARFIRETFAIQPHLSNRI
jgi:hypothetical protein